MKIYMRSEITYLFGLSCVVFLSSTWKNVGMTIRLCFCPINSVLLNLLCVWILYMFRLFQIFFITSVVYFDGPHDFYQTSFIDAAF